MTQPYLTDEAEIDEHNAMTAVRKVVADLRANPTKIAARDAAAIYLRKIADLTAIYGGDLTAFADALEDFGDDTETTIKDYAPDFDTWEEAVQLKAMGE